MNEWEGVIEGKIIAYVFYVRTPDALLRLMDAVEDATDKFDAEVQFYAMACPEADVVRRLDGITKALETGA